MRILVTATNPDGSVGEGSQPTALVQSAPVLNTAAPTISGTPQRASKLTMTSAGAWTGIGNTYTYQWQRSPDRVTWTSIPGATAKTYALAAADERDYVRILVTGTNPAGSAGQGSQPTALVQGGPVLNTAAPTISGTPQRTRKLTMTSAGAWTGIGNKYIYQWQRSSDGVNWTNIAGATGKVYTLAVADGGDYVRILVTATNPDGSVGQGSQPTALVQSAAVVNTVAPAISGTAQRSFKLTATQGTWTGIGNKYIYQWQRSSDGVNWTNIAGATGKVYTLAVADEGDYVRILVTGTNPVGSVGQGSQPTALVQSAAEVNAVAPVISGTAQRSFRLTATQGTWTGIGNKYTYQWQRSPDGVTWTGIAGAIARTYTLAVADEGDHVRILVTATNPDGTLAVPSAPTAAVGISAQARSRRIRARRSAR